MKDFSIIIPARYGSTRFAGKPLVKINGLPMIQHVYERALRSGVADDVIVATDDERILNIVKGFGGIARMTSSHHKTGTERVAEIAKEITSKWIINIQGDEPLIDPDVIKRLCQEMTCFPNDVVFSLMRPIFDYSELNDPNVVKVVVDNMGYALYFSRASIPYPRKSFMEAEKILDRGHPHPSHKQFQRVFIHCGIYGYERNFLLKIPDMPSSFLEYTECLEQLRILFNGYRINMVVSNYHSVGVDTPDDIRRVEGLLKGEKVSKGS